MISIVIWCLGFGSYLLFAGTISPSELLTGFILAMLADLWAKLVRANTRRRFSAGGEQIAPVLRALVGLFPAAVRTTAALCKIGICGGSPGRSTRSRFQAGSANDPRQRTRRALAVLCASLAPDRFVVDVDSSRGEALLHAIDRSAHAADLEWLL